MRGFGFGLAHVRPCQKPQPTLFMYSSNMYMLGLFSIPQHIVLSSSPSCTEPSGKPPSFLPSGMLSIKLQPESS